LANLETIQALLRHRLPMGGLNEVLQLILQEAADRLRAQRGCMLKRRRTDAASLPASPTKALRDADEPRVSALPITAPLSSVEKRDSKKGKNHADWPRRAEKAKHRAEAGQIFASTANGIQRTGTVDPPNKQDPAGKPPRQAGKVPAKDFAVFARRGKKAAYIAASHSAYSAPYTQSRL